MKIEGRCHCGKIAYEAHIDPAKAAICNCTDCQTLSGAPFRASVPARVEDFRLISGTLKMYVKTAESGTKRVQTFCGDCGSPIYATTFENPALYNLRLGAVKQRAQIKPQNQIWRDSALGWAQDVSGIPGKPKGQATIRDQVSFKTSASQSGRSVRMASMPCAVSVFMIAGSSTVHAPIFSSSDRASAMLSAVTSV